jgi:hypothetical protein
MVLFAGKPISLDKSGILAGTESFGLVGTLIVGITISSFKEIENER